MDIKKNLKNLILYMLLFFSISSVAQKKDLKYEIKTSGAFSSKSTLPFWLISNQHGIIPDENNGLLFLKLESDFTPSKAGFDFSYAASLVGLQGNKSELFFNELYASLKWKTITFDLGIKHDKTKYDDIAMSNGNLLFSGNSRSYPKLSIEIKDYVSVPYTNDWLAVKGVFSNGIFLDDRYVDKANVHHKNAFLRIGKEQGLSFAMGLDHYAQWGGTSPKWGNLGGFSAFKEAVLIQSGKVLIDKNGNESISESHNKSGNHIGQHSFELTYTNNKISSSLALKNIYEDKSGDFRHLSNVKDWNVSFYFNFKNQKLLSSFIYEYYTSKDQGGFIIRPEHSIEPIIGFDSYFNNGVFKSGWTNFNRTIGLPLFTTRIVDGEARGVDNNALSAHHFGFRGIVAKFKYKAMVTLSNNYGTLILKNDGNGQEQENYYKAYSFPKSLSQQSYMLEVSLPKINKIPFLISTRLALDTGKYLPENIGFQLNLSYRGIFSK